MAATAKAMRSRAERVEMELVFKKCRNWRHAWDDFIADRRTHPVIYESPEQETLRCLRCGTERYRGIGYTGEVESSQYDYADGYLYEDVDDRPELEVLRLSLIQELKAIGRQRQRSTAHRTTAKKPGVPKKATARRPVRKQPTRRRHLTAV